MAHDHDHGHTHHQHDDDALAELVDLEAEVMHGYLTDVISLVERMRDSAPARILDLGAGTAAGTIALAQHFSEANVTAVDQSDEMLTRAAAKIDALGLGARVTLVLADLDDTWPALGPVDLAWASLSLHHLVDPERTLRNALGALNPGGLLVVAEIDTLPRFLPEDLGIGRPGLELRCHEALDAGWRARLPEIGADWGSRLSRVGFSGVDQRVFDVHLTPPLPPATGRYAQIWLQRSRSRLDGLLDADDLTTLDTLAGDGPQSVLRRDDLVLRWSRTVWTARRT